MFSRYSFDTRVALVGVLCLILPLQYNTVTFNKRSLRFDLNIRIKVIVGEIKQSTLNHSNRGGGVQGTDIWKILIAYVLRNSSLIHLGLVGWSCHV